MATIKDYNYRKLFLNEQMGVIARVFQEKEVYDISKITNDFLKKIYKNPNKSYTDYYEILTNAIQIKYDPNTNNSNNAQTNGNIIYIYTHATKENYFQIKYLIIHELVHVIQLWYDREYDYMNRIEKIKYYFRKQYIDKLSKLKANSSYKKFIYLLYREDLYEIYAWAHDAYINAFLCKVKNSKIDNQNIVNIVLKNIFINTQFLNNVINNIKNNKRIYNIIIEILVSHFAELDGNNGQRFFDKHIFELDIVKQLRKDVKYILQKENNASKTVKDIKHLIKTYNSELLEAKDIIIDSFIEHMKYWYSKALKQYGKAIQLGIDDAKPKRFRNI